MNEVEELATEITARYGVVKRARGCFLYTAKGVRLTDLYQEGGRAILGWGGAGAFSVLKNVLSRGITGSFDTDFAPRADGSAKSQLSRAAGALLGDVRAVSVHTSKQSALKTALSVAPQTTAVYRPWAQDADWAACDAVVIEPPLAWTPHLFLLAVKADVPCEAHGVRIAAPLCAAVTRSLYDLVAAVRVRQEKDWFIYDTALTRYWTRRGPYLFPKVPQSCYGDFLRHCLAQELVISPTYEQPSIVPFGADAGVFRKLQRNPFALP